MWKETKNELPETDTPILLIAEAGASRANIASYSKARHRFEIISPYVTGAIPHFVEYWMALPSPPKLSKDAKHDMECPS